MVPDFSGWMFRDWCKANDYLGYSDEAYWCAYQGVELVSALEEEFTYTTTFATELPFDEAVMIAQEYCVSRFGRTGSVFVRLTSSLKTTFAITVGKRG